MYTSVRKLGNSAGIIIPKAILADLGLAAGDAVDLRLEGDRLVLIPAPRATRAGWAEASRDIAAGGDDRLVWTEFGNIGDAELTW